MRIRCKGYWYYPAMEPPEFECGYEKADFDCDQCIINGGSMSPISGKPFRGNPEPYYEDCRKRYGAKYFDPEPETFGFEEVEPLSVRQEKAFAAWRAARWAASYEGASKGEIEKAQQLKDKYFQLLGQTPEEYYNL